MAHLKVGSSSTVSRSNWNLEMLDEDENQQQSQPTSDAESGNRTWAALVGGKCSHHCAILALLYLKRQVPYHIDRIDPPVHILHYDQFEPVQK